MRYILSFWINNEAGDVFFQFHPNQINLSSEFVAVVFKTLKTFAKRTQSNKMSGLEIQNFFFLLHQEQNIDFFAVTTKKEYYIPALDELKIIASRFLQSYPVDLLQTWSGDKEIFFNFYHQIPFQNDIIEHHS